MEHQTQVCQTIHFIECPVYQRETNGALPRKLRGRHDGIGPGRKRVQRIFLLLMILALGILLLLEIGIRFHLLSWGYSLPDFSPKTFVSSPFVFQTFTPSLTPSPWLATLPGLVVPFLPPEGTATLTSVYALTPTASPIAGSCGYPRDTPIGIDQKFIIHRIAGGESLNGYETDYHTTSAAILAVNYNLRVPVPSNIVIVIPLDQTEAHGLPVFETYLADEPNSSIEALSAKLDTNPQEFARYNNLPQVCNAFSGWLLVPKQAPTPSLRN